MLSGEDDVTLVAAVAVVDDGEDVWTKVASVAATRAANERTAHTRVEIK